MSDDSTVLHSPDTEGLPYRVVETQEVADVTVPEAIRGEPLGTLGAWAAST